MGKRGKARGPSRRRAKGCQVRVYWSGSAWFAPACCAAGHCNPPAGTGASKAIPPLPYQRASRARRCRIYQIGRPVQGGERKLVIGHAARSYVALHHYIEALDTVFVLAVRSPLEAGVKR